uniref:Leptin n=1 Tax=Gopherus agassizii TaxID=38772 RepID=A0A452GK41_9SAUR
MWCPSLPLCGLLCIWLPLFYSRPVKIDKVKADTKNLTRTIIPGRGSVSGGLASGMTWPMPRAPGQLWGPGKNPLLGGGSLAPRQKHLAQIFNDIENLRSLIQTLGSHLGCTFHKSSNLDALGNLTELLTTSPYTTAVVALDRLQKCLHSIVKHLDHIQSC